MNELVKKLIDIINPPGLAKPGRGAVFSTISAVFERVKDDADAAFKAFFPYLADEKKLEQHGKALLVPHLLSDSGDEYRNRVATASFFLTRSGERAYVISQLESHFGDRYLLTEQFLELYVKILDLSEDDKTWVLEFLDSTLDPNILLTVAEWFHFLDTVYSEAVLSPIRIPQKRQIDVYPAGLRCDGRWLCDWGTEILCDGTWLMDGSVKCAGFMPTRGTTLNTALVSVFCDGSWRMDGSQDCSGYRRIHCDDMISDTAAPLKDDYGDRVAIQVNLMMIDTARIVPRCDGLWLMDGSNLDSMVDAPMTVRIIKQIRCDGNQPRPSLMDGAITLDGSYTGYDGWRCSGDIIHEEVV
jgi:hypothetical protein